MVKQKFDIRNIKLLCNDDSSLWDDFVNKNKKASIYHLAEWRNIIGKIFGHKTYYLYAVDDSDVICGILPLVRLKSRVFGDFLVSMPFYNYGGAVGNSIVVESALMKHACKLSSGLKASHIEFRDLVEHGSDWQVRKDKVVMELELPSSADELWKGFKPKLRAQIRKPTKEGAQVEHGGSELLNDFYRVFSENMRDLGTPVYSRSFFEEILLKFPNQAFITVVMYQGQPVAVAFLLGYRGRLEIPWASSLRKYNKLGVNMLLYWEVLQKAIDKGYKIFDFGRSSIDAGTYRFKKQWGAQPRQLYWHYCIKENGAMPNITPNNPKYKLAISLWKKLPLPVANFLGPWIVKYLP